MSTKWPSPRVSAHKESAFEDSTQWRRTPDCLSIIG